MVSAPIKIYTDGSCSPNPGPGGWAALLIFEGTEKVVELQGAEQDSTNNRMELMAALRAMQSLGDGCVIDMHTDSKYLQQGITEWLDSWKKNGWLTRDKTAVKNRDLWEALAEAMKRHQVKWRWVKGHAEDIWNIRVDELAAAARRSQYSHVEDSDAVKLYTGVTWKNSSNRGAWVTILSYRSFTKVLGDGARDATANKLYLVSVIEGLKALKKKLPVHLYTQSGYVRDGLGTWLPGWQKRNWCTREGGEVSNREEWQQIARFKEKYDITLVPLNMENPPCHMQEAKALAREFDDFENMV